MGGLTTIRTDRFRWVICALLFAATTVNYMDRQAIALLKPLLAEQFGWSQIDYANIVVAFQTAYAVGYLVAGRLMDRVGVKVGLSLAVAIWSLACAGHGAARSVAGFCVARGGLGLAQGGHFPGAIKSVGDWFPKGERALATGIFNSGSNVGAMTAPFVVPWLAVRFGWQAAFLVLGVFGAVWVVLWGWACRHPERHAVEIAASGAAESATPWLKLLAFRPTWAFSLATFLISPIWWFYLFWVPPFLHERHGLDITQLGWPLVLIYSMTTVGSVGGGWLSSRLMRRGWRAGAARKCAMLVCALCTVPVFAAAAVTHLWAAVAVIGLAAAAHQGFSANLFTLVSDTMPRHSVSSVVGIGGMAGAVGGMLVAKATGYVLEWTGSYQILFLMAASAYLVALAVIHLLLPQWGQVGEGRREADGKG